MQSSLARPFLTAEWRNLVMLNYEVDRRLLSPFIPRGTELDSWNGRVFISLVGFLFLKTKVLGLSIPRHTNFEEVNLRFYVRRDVEGEVRRGVVFIREIVPRHAIAFIARTFYNENYMALPMSHKISATLDNGMSVAYRWKSDGGWSEIHFESQGRSEAPQEDSEEQFITEHYWGYAAQADGGCVEYQVTHPSWKVWRAKHAEFRGSTEKLYGAEFAAILRGKLASSFLAEGSPVSVMRGHKL